MPDDVKSPAEQDWGKDYISWPNIERAARIRLEKRREAGELRRGTPPHWVALRPSFQKGTSFLVQPGQRDSTSCRRFPII